MRFTDKNHSEDSTRMIRFLGGKNTLFFLITILLIGLIILVYKQIPFIFFPLKVFFSTVILPVILATIGYYLLRPILRLLEKIHIKRPWGILILFLGVSGLITLLVFLVLPFLKLQIHNLAEDFPVYFKQLVIDLDGLLRASIFSSFYESLEVSPLTLLESAPENLGKIVTNTVGGIASGISSFVSALTGFVLAIATVPIILFYLLKDGGDLPRFFVKMLPPRIRKDAAELLHDADNQISSYIQGQILVAISIGVMVSIGFLIIDMDYALLLGALAMFTSIVPYLGPVIAITPALIIAIVTSPFMILKLAVVWTVVQLIDGKFISPQIMGKSLRIHPVTIIFVLLTAGSLFGVVGVLIGIPTYALIKVFITYFFKLFKLRYNRYVPETRMHYEDIEGE